MNDRERLVIWAAGFVDGEGCLAITRVKPKTGWHQMALRLSVGQRVREPLDILQALFGGGVYEEGSRSLFMWVIQHRQAAAAIAELLPYLVVKKGQAEVGLAFQSRRHVGGHKGRLNVNLPEDERDYAAIKAMKRPWLRAV